MVTIDNFGFEKEKTKGITVKVKSMHASYINKMYMMQNINEN